MLKIFQSTLPARGATGDTLYLYGRLWHFNPRSPHGERHNWLRGNALKGGFQSTLPARGATWHGICRQRQHGISIHAPRTGSDFLVLFTLTANANFNPRSPHGERHLLPIATCVQLISIHAPRTGSDGEYRVFGRHRQNFNPRSPHGERPLVYSPHADKCISIHAPRTGSDVSNSDSICLMLISIHAPRTGSDRN